MTSTESIFRPKIPDDPSEIPLFIQTELDTYFGALKADALNELTYPRFGVVDPAANDNAQYRAKAQYYGDGGSTDQERAKHKLFLLDQSMHAKIKALAKGSILDAVDCEPEDKNRASALVHRWLQNYDLPVETKLTTHKSKVVSTEGYESQLITWPEHLNTRTQAAIYFKDIDMAVKRHRLADTADADPINDTDLTKRLMFPNPEKVGTPRTGILPERFTESWVTDNLDPIKDDWAAFKKKIITFDLKRGDQPGSTSNKAAGTAFAVRTNDDKLSTKMKAIPKGLSKDEQKKHHCPHYHLNEEGCGFADADCNFLHDGTGKLNLKRIAPHAKRKRSEDKTGHRAGKGNKHFKNKVPAGKYRVAYTASGDPKFQPILSEDEAEEDKPKKKKKKAAKGSWFVANHIKFGSQLIAMAALFSSTSESKVDAVSTPLCDGTEWCACIPCRTDPNPHNISGFQMCDSFAADPSETSEANYRYQVSAASVQHNPRHPGPDEGFFIYDTGATVTVKRLKHGFNSDYRKVTNHPPVRVAEGTLVKVLGTGSVTLEVVTNRGPKRVTLRNVLHCPDFDVDVLSRVQLRKEGFGFACDDELNGMRTPQGLNVTFVDHENLSYLRGTYAVNNCTTLNSPGSTVIGQFVANCESSTEDTDPLLSLLNEPGLTHQKRDPVRLKLADLGTYSTNSPKHDELLKLHAWLGHPSIERTVEYVKENYTDAEVRKRFGAVGYTFCKSCALNKTTFSHKGSVHKVKASGFGQTTHTDIYGKLRPPSHGTNARYCICFIDEATSHAVTYALDNLQQIPEAIDIYYSWVDTVLRESKMAALSTLKDVSIVRNHQHDYSGHGQRLHSDSHSVYRSKRSLAALAKRNVTWSGSAPGQQFQNGVSEHFWGSTVPRADAMADSAGLNPPAFKIWTMLHAAHTHNITPTKANSEGESPTLSAHRLTGHPDFKRDQAKLHTFGRPIWAKRLHREHKDIEPSRMGLYIGTNYSNNSRRIWFPATATRRATYAESNHVQFERNEPLLDRVVDGKVPLTAQGYSEYLGTGVEDDTVVVGQGGGDVIDIDYWRTQNASAADQSSGGVTDLDYWLAQGQQAGPNANIVFAPLPTVNTVYWTKKSAYNSEHGHLFNASDEAEFSSKIQRGVLRPTRMDAVPKGATFVNTLMGRKMKLRDGKPERAKPRMCANDKGSAEELLPQQVRTVTPRWSSNRTFFAIAAGAGMTCYDYDLPNAFDQAPADKLRVCRAPFDMRQYTSDGVEIVYIMANMQGHRAAGRNYQNHLNRFTKHHGWQQNKGDPSTYYRPPMPPTGQQDAPPLAAMYMIIHIDDCIYASTSNKAHEWWAHTLRNKWDPQHTKAASRKTDFVLGAKVTQKDGSISISTPALVDKLVAEMGMEGCYRVDTPMNAKSKIKLDDGAPLNKEQHRLYRMGTATLLYLSCVCRPDLCYVASQLGKAQHAPTDTHFEILTRAIAYTNATRTYGVTYYFQPDINTRNKIHGFADSSWADCPDTRRSTAGYIAFMNGGYISAHSRVLKTVALSTAEAELMAATEAAKDLAHLGNVCGGFGIGNADTTIGEDNSAALLMATDLNHSVTSRSKHIQARHFYVRDLCTSSEDDDGNEIPPLMRMYHVPTDDQRADIATKPLEKISFTRHRDAIVRHIEAGGYEQPANAELSVGVPVY